MKSEVNIILAEDDEGHAILVEKNLRRSGIMNKIIHFRDGEETLNYFFDKHSAIKRDKGVPYLLLLDIRMPKVDGIQVLTKLKSHPEFCKIPIIILTTTDDPKEISKCYSIGCSTYITKPIEYNKFVDALGKLGLFLMIVEVPPIDS